MPQHNQRQKKSNEDQGGSWILSFGDMMSLLCTFFILLLSFSRIEIVQFRRFLGSLQGANGVLGEMDGSSAVQRDVANPGDANVSSQIIRELIEGMDADDDDESDKSDFSIEQTDDGWKIKISDPVMFQAATDILKPEARPVLDKIGGLLQAARCDVRIEGHTDNSPISTPQYPSNWELSSARAMTVLMYFVDKNYVVPRRIEAVGKGPYFPIASNETPEGRMANRRVEIYMTYIIQSGRELLFERHSSDY
ncbi:hypothetical protein A2V82_15330 [candidate division KSB1 bacterium RBG_16_48_16]|nr:MAG: hypothetical protein A2V82_15330 [candidate division KSB1 bacterium RBG_16_48_16]